MYYINYISLSITICPPQSSHELNETGQADRNKTGREQKKSKPLARSLQEDYSGSEEEKKRTHARIRRRVKQQ